jgi:hypothetical protein
MQCKDIPDRPILEFLEARAGQWASWYDPEWAENSVRHAMPPLPNEKLALAKMRQLMKRGLVDGCSCGCRGDFVITAKGSAMLSVEN